MTSTTTVRPTSTPATARSTDPARRTQQRRNRRIGALATGGLAVAALAAGGIIWATAVDEPTVPAPAPLTGPYVSDASAGALVARGGLVSTAENPVTNDAAAGSLVGHGTTFVIPRAITPALSDADAGALVGNRRL